MEAKTKLGLGPILTGLPRRALTNIELLKYVPKLKIANFRGVFMRDRLPKMISFNECGIINLDNDSGPGTHWVSYIKRGRQIIYFDSIGDLKPPPEVITYFASGGIPIIKYNFTRYQDLNTYNCGRLVLEFLHRYK